MKWSAVGSPAADDYARASTAGRVLFVAHVPMAGLGWGTAALDCGNFFSRTQKTAGRPGGFRSYAHRHSPCWPYRFCNQVANDRAQLLSFFRAARHAHGRTWATATWRPETNHELRLADLFACRPAAGSRAR